MDENQEELEAHFLQLKSELQKNDLQDFREHFLEMHIYDQGQFYQSLDGEERQLVYSYMSPKELADMFDVIEEDDEHVEEYLSEMRPRYAADMLSEMYTDNAVDILNELDKKQVAKYLSLMEPEHANEIRELLHYEDDTAGSIMTTEFVSIVANQTVRSAMYVLKKKHKSPKRFITHMLLIQTISLWELFLYGI